MIKDKAIKDFEELINKQYAPCVQSGFCCTLAPCAYGEWNEDKSACKFLSEPKNDLGQKDCLKYDWIKENVPGWEYYPAFGAGCGSALGNTPRQEIIKKLKERNENTTGNS